MQKSHSPSWLIYALIPLMVCAAVSLPLKEILADTIVLRNGRRIYGKVIGQTRTTIRVRIDGRVRVIRKKTIRKLSYGDSAVEKRRAAAAAKRAEARRRAAAERKRRAELARKRAAEKRRAEAARKAALARKQAEDRRKAELARKQAEDRRKAALARKQAEDKRKAELARKQAEDRRKAALARKQAEDKRKAELARKQAEEKRRAAAARANAKDNRRVAGKTKTGTDWSYVWKSAVLPGWGHWSNGDTLTGWIYTGSFIGLLAATVSASSSASSAEATYNSEITTNTAAGTAAGGSGTDTGQLLFYSGISGSGSNFDAFQSATNRYNAALALTGLLYIGQLVHAWLSSGSSSKKIADAEKPGAGRLEFTMGFDGSAKAKTGASRRMEVRYGFRF